MNGVKIEGSVPAGRAGSGRIALACDHVGFALKKDILEHLLQRGYTCADFGTHSQETVDYPPYAERAARAVVAGEVDGAILICGTGLGMSLAANKVRGARCAVCSEPYSARMAKLHNNANILAFGARVVGVEVARMMVDEWLGAKFEPRHQRRLDQITALEARECAAHEPRIPPDKQEAQSSASEPSSAP